jgi:catechol 2,3-dioxygenase-like lactoylglutathione lyase family enzyme
MSVVFYRWETMYRQHRRTARKGAAWETEKKMLRVDHINIHANDLPGMIRFLEAVLGAKEGFRPPFKHPGHWLYLDGQPLIHLDPAGAGESGTRGVFDHIAFGVYDDFDSLKARVEAAGFEHFLAGIPGGVGQIFVIGPENVKLELQYRR